MAHIWQALCGLVIVCSVDAAGTAAGTLTGRVTDGQAGLRNAVVWVEPEGPLPTFPPPVQHAEMAQVNLAFVPRVLPILVGTTVDFPNRDTVYHSIFSFSRQQRFEIGLYPPGEHRTVTFERVGLVKLFCNIHDQMFGAILVLPTPYFSASTDDGSFTIADIPAGASTVQVWHDRLRGPPQGVSITADGTTRLTVVLQPNRRGD
jgi:plastocyanin